MTELQFICEACTKGVHHNCKGHLWCDCAHRVEEPKK